MASRKKADPQGAIRLLIPSMEIAPWSKEFVEDLQLPKGEKDHVLFELECLQIVAVQFAMVQVFEEDSDKLDALLTAYHQYWSAYSMAVAVNYGREVYRRLHRYREAAFGEKPSDNLQVGKVFSNLCGVSGANFVAFGTNAFAGAYSAAVRVIGSLEIDFSAGQ